MEAPTPRVRLRENMAMNVYVYTVKEVQVLIYASQLLFPLEAVVSLFTLLLLTATVARPNKACVLNVLCNPAT